MQLNASKIQNIFLRKLLKRGEQSVPRYLQKCLSSVKKCDPSKTILRNNFLGQLLINVNRMSK